MTLDCRLTCTFSHGFVCEFPLRGLDHADVVRDLNNLARIRWDVGQSEAALPLQERALAITEAARWSEPSGGKGSNMTVLRDAVLVPPQAPICAVFSTRLLPGDRATAVLKTDNPDVLVWKVASVGRSSGKYLAWPVLRCLYAW